MPCQDEETSVFASSRPSAVQLLTRSMVNSDQRSVLPELKNRLSKRIRAAKNDEDHRRRNNRTRETINSRGFLSAFGASFIFVFTSNTVTIWISKPNLQLVNLLALHGHDNCIH